MSGYKIELKDVKFFAFHGLHDQERKTGNDFVVNLSVALSNDVVKVTGIKEKIDYGVIYEILHEQMMQPVDLLETLAYKISESIHTRFPAVRKISISIEKKNPAILSFQGSVGVTFDMQY